MSNEFKHYRLNKDTGEIREAFGMESMHEAFEVEDRSIRKDVVNGVLVSTIFLVLDHSFGLPAPLLFETMLFDEQSGKCTSDFQERYFTMKEAIDGHYRVCEQLRKGEIKV